MLPRRSISTVQPASFAHCTNWSRISLSSADSANRRKPTSRKRPIPAERSSVLHSRSGLISSRLATTEALLRCDGLAGGLRRPQHSRRFRHAEVEAADQAGRREVHRELTLDLLGAGGKQARAEAAALWR